MSVHNDGKYLRTAESTDNKLVGIEVKIVRISQYYLDKQIFARLNKRRKRMDARNSLRRNSNHASILPVLQPRENVRRVCVSRRYQSVHKILCRILYLSNALSFS